MRTTLVGWLVQVFDSPFVARLQSCGREHALLSALFLTIDLTDRFLSVHQVDRSELMLLGLCALRLAVLYEHGSDVADVLERVSPPISARRSSAPPA